MEQQVGPLGWETIRTPRRGQMRLHTYQMIGHGAEVVSYFAGARPASGPSSTGTASSTTTAGRTAACGAGRAGAGARASRRAARRDVPAVQVAVVYDYDARFALELQPTNPALGHVDALRAHYGALKRQGVEVDLLAPTADLASYRLVVAPSLYVLDEDVAAALRSYVESGGLLVLGPRSGFKDRANAVPERPLPAWLDELAGLEVSDIASFLDDRHARSRASTVPPGVSRLVRGAQARGARPLYRYRDTDFAGSAAVAINAVGAGRVVYVGGVATDDTLDGLYAWLAREAGLDVFDAPADVEVVRLLEPESGRELLFLLNYADEERKISIPGGA